jgi:hypothetical protein
MQLLLKQKLPREVNSLGGVGIQES